MIYVYFIKKSHINNSFFNNYQNLLNISKIIDPTDAEHMMIFTNTYNSLLNKEKYVTTVKLIDKSTMQLLDNCNEKVASIKYDTSCIQQGALSINNNLHTLHPAMQTQISLQNENFNLFTYSLSFKNNSYAKTLPINNISVIHNEIIPFYKIGLHSNVFMNKNCKLINHPLNSLYTTSVSNFISLYTSENFFYIDDFKLNPLKVKYLPTSIFNLALQQNLTNNELIQLNTNLLQFESKINDLDLPYSGNFMLKKLTGDLWKTNNHWKLYHTNTSFNIYFKNTNLLYSKNLLNESDNFNEL